MPTPVADRVMRADNAGGYLTSSGVARLRKMLRDESRAAEFHDWACSPFGAAVTSAIRDLALNGPHEAEAKDVAVQYGISLGLNLAAMLLSDPSSVYPEVFTNATGQAAVPQSPDYSVSPQEALDDMFPDKQGE